MRKPSVQSPKDGSPAASVAEAVKAASPSRKRADKSAARRQAIVAAALEEFCGRGFASTRLDDVAARAGVAKGTIYLHFKDKEALFREIITTMLGPIVSVLEIPPPPDVPIRTVVERLAAHFIREVYRTPKGDVIRLVLTEGPRFPQLAEFHYRHVVERAIAAMKKLLQQALDRGEIADASLIEFPQLVVAPMIMAIIWSGLFDRIAPLDAPGLVRAHLDILFGKGRAP